MNMRDPSRDELARILKDSAYEVQRLRRENEVLAAQVRVIDVFDRALARGGNMCASPDTSYMLGQLAEHYSRDIDPPLSPAAQRPSDAEAI